MFVCFLCKLVICLSVSLTVSFSLLKEPGFLLLVPRVPSCWQQNAGNIRRGRRSDITAVTFRSRPDHLVVPGGESYQTSANRHTRTCCTFTETNLLTRCFPGEARERERKTVFASSHKEREEAITSVSHAENFPVPLHRQAEPTARLTVKSPLWFSRFLTS